MKKKLLILAAIFFIGGLGAAFGFAAGQGRLHTPIHPPKSALTQLLWETYDELKARYIAPGDLSDEKLLYGAIRGLVEASGDPYTQFFTPDEARLFLEDTSGHFDGIGAEIGFREGRLTVIAPLEDSPAAAAGLLSGDAIFSIDGTETAHMTLEEAVSRMRGPAGSTVTLEIGREQQDTPLTLSIARSRITIPTLELSRRDDNIAVVRLFNFSEDSPQRFREAVSELSAAPPRGIILDLRNNPGGYLDAAVEIAGWMLEPDTPVVIERQRDAADITDRANGSGALRSMPIVVLMNRGTASAAEILAGALRDERAVSLIGETSFGKGTVQEFPRLSGGAALKVTIGEWLTPKGTSLREGGLIPDVSIADDPDTPEDEVMERAVVLLTSL